MRISRKQLRIILYEEMNRTLLLESKQKNIISFFNSVLQNGIKATVDNSKKNAAKTLGALKGLATYPKEIYDKMKGAKELYGAIKEVLLNKDLKPEEIKVKIIEAARKTGIASTNAGIDSIMSFFVLIGPGKLLVDKLAGAAKKYLQDKINYIAGDRMLKALAPKTYDLFKKAAERSAKGGLVAAFDTGKKDFKGKLKRIKDSEKEAMEDALEKTQYVWNPGKPKKIEMTPEKVKAIRDIFFDTKDKEVNESLAEKTIKLTRSHLRRIILETL